MDRPITSECVELCEEVGALGMGLSLGKWVTEGVPLSRKWETCLLRVTKPTSELSLSVCLVPHFLAAVR